MKKYIPYSKTELMYRLAEVDEDLIATVTELAFVRSEELRAEMSAEDSGIDTVAGRARLGKRLAAEHTCSVYELEGKKEGLQIEQSFLERLLSQ